MKRSFHVMLLTIFLLLIPAAKTFGSSLDSGFELGVGERIDNLNWNIAGDLNGQNPNILSELAWGNLRIIEIKAVLTAELADHLFYRGTLGFGRINDGAIQDSDYQEDDRTAEFSRSNNKNHGDNIFDLDLALGYRIVSRPSTNIAILTGYSDRRQNLRITDGYQTIPADGPFAGLNSTYRSDWSGPWIGASLSQRVLCGWVIYSQLEYHSGSYRGEGNWNLRDDLAHPVSFLHQAAGTGRVFIIGLNYTAENRWFFELNFNRENWSAKNGINETFYAGGTTGFNRLNEVNWDSTVMTVKAGHLF